MVSQNVTAVSPINPLVTIQPVATSATSHDVPAAPPQLQNIANGALIEGFVVNRDAQNNPIVRTSLGDLIVQSDVFIKTGSTVVFRVDTTQASRARIVTIDQLSPEEYVAQSPQGLTEDTIAAPQLKPQGSPSVPTLVSQPLPVLPAVVLQATTQTTLAQAALFPLAAQQAGTVKAPPIPPALAQLAPGTALTLTVIDVKLPPQPVALSTIAEAPDLDSLLPLKTSTLPANTGSTLPISTPGTALLAAQENDAPTAVTYSGQYNTSQTAGSSPTAQQSVAIPIGSTLTDAAADTSPSANSSPIATLSTLSSAPSLEATVIGHAADGSNILRTSFATVKLYTEQPLPTGTTLEIQVQVKPTDTADLPPILTHLPAPNPGAPEDFSYLNQALSQLQTLDPNAARDLLQQLPVLGAKFTSGLLFFMTAVKTGDIRAALNPRTLARIEANSPGLLARLSKDIGLLHQNFTDSPLEEWKAIPLPLLYQNEANSARLYVRKEDQQEKTVEKTDAGQRFLLDLHLSQLGPMQLDGFVRSSERAKSLELYLRSSEPLDSTTCNDLHMLFENALQTTGLGGRLIFQAGQEHFIKPQRAPISRPDNEAGTHTILA